MTATTGSGAFAGWLGNNAQRWRAFVREWGRIGDAFWFHTTCRGCDGAGRFIHARHGDAVCGACNGTGRVESILGANPAPKCSGCQFNTATRRDADDVADVCDCCGEASDEQKAERERRERNAARREEV